VALTILIRQLGSGAEGARILDRLESATGIHGERVEGGRRYDMDASRDLVVAMASITAHLDAITDAWRTYIQIDVDAT
jgi:hypothetical protein